MKASSLYAMMVPSPPLRVSIAQSSSAPGHDGCDHNVNGANLDGSCSNHHQGNSTQSISQFVQAESKNDTYCDESVLFDLQHQRDDGLYEAIHNAELHHNFGVQGSCTLSWHENTSDDLRSLLCAKTAGQHRPTLETPTRTACSAAGLSTTGIINRPVNQLSVFSHAIVPRDGATLQ